MLVKNPNVKSKSDSYTISPLSEGYMAKCTVRPEISVYGETPAVALEKIENAIHEYEKVFKKKAK